MSLSCLVFVFVLSLPLLKFRLNLNLNQVFMGAHFVPFWHLPYDCIRTAGDTGLILPGPGSLWRGAGGTPDRFPSRQIFHPATPKNAKNRVVLVVVLAVGVRFWVGYSRYAPETAWVGFLAAQHCCRCRNAGSAQIGLRRRQKKSPAGR